MQRDLDRNDLKLADLLKSYYGCHERVDYALKIAKGEKICRRHKEKPAYDWFKASKKNSESRANELERIKNLNPGYEFANKMTNYHYSKMLRTPWAYNAIKYKRYWLVPLSIAELYAPIDNQP